MSNENIDEMKQMALFLDWKWVGWGDNLKILKKEISVGSGLGFGGKGVIGVLGCLDRLGWDWGRIGIGIGRVLWFDLGIFIEVILKRFCMNSIGFGFKGQ